MSTPVARSCLEDDHDPLKSPSRPAPRPARVRDEQGDGGVPPLQVPVEPTPSTQTPLSFKRRTSARHASAGSVVRDKAASLLGGILRTGSFGPADPSSSSSSPPNISPAFTRPDAAALPRHVTLPHPTIRPKQSLSSFSQAIASDEDGGGDGEGADEDEDEDGETTAGESPTRQRGTLGAGPAPRRRRDEADRQRQRRLSGGQRVALKGSPRSRRPTGTGAYGSPVKEPGALSPLWAEHPYRIGDDGDDDGPSDETLLDGGGDVAPLEVTPLPKIPIFVLSICMLGEFLSASVCSPFLFLCVAPGLLFPPSRAGFGKSRAISLTPCLRGPQHGGKLRRRRERRRRIGRECLDGSRLCGLVRRPWSSHLFSPSVSGPGLTLFLLCRATTHSFLSQFATAMLWVSIAEKHGRRAVLCASLIGNGLTVVAFGTSQNLGTAICTRLAMGLFNGEPVSRGALSMQQQGC